MLEQTIKELTALSSPSGFEQEAAEHTLEIRMMEGSKDKCFTITCIGIVE